MSPTYQSVCRGDGHTEALKVEYDPAVVTYEDIMRRVLSQAHGGACKAQCACTRSSDGSAQAPPGACRALVLDRVPADMSAVWSVDEQQAAIATRVAKELGKESSVPIMPAAPWHDAEDYHQKCTGTRALRAAELRPCKRRRSKRLACSPLSLSAALTGRPACAPDGLLFPSYSPPMASDGLRWPLMASDGL